MSRCLCTHDVNEQETTPVYEALLIEMTTDTEVLEAIS